MTFSDLAMWAVCVAVATPFALMVLGAVGGLCWWLFGFLKAPAELPDIYARCDRAPRGWWCSRPPQHDGPCAARPRWWNFRRLTRRHSTSLTVSEDL